MLSLVKVQLILEQQQLAPYWVPSQRLSIDFGPHPRTIMLAAGTKLLRTTIGKPGQLCGQFTLLHQLPEGEFFTAIAIPCKVSHSFNTYHVVYLDHCLWLCLYMDNQTRRNFK